MKKILFYTANGVGLGHLRRTSLIAQSIRNLNPKTDVLFTTMCKKVFFLDEMKIPYIKLKYLTDDLLKDKRQFGRIKTFNEKKFLEIIKRYRPNLIVVDAHLFGFSFPEIILSPFLKKITKVLIFRKGDQDNFCKILREDREKINKFKKVILPHSLIELKETLPKKIFNNITKEKRFIVTDPIFKKLDSEKITECRNKYNISDKDFLITVALGGGGELVGGKCEASVNIILNFIRNYKKLKKMITNLKAVISTGPFFAHGKKLEIIKNQFGQDIRIVSYEKHLLELMYLSKFIISPASYNICNEIIETKTPAILVPLLRGNNEQYERALYLKKKGIVKVFHNNSNQQFLDLIIGCKKNLDKMRLNFKKFAPWRQGNNKTANIIFNLLKN